MTATLETKLMPFGDLSNGKNPDRIQKVDFERDEAVDRMFILYESFALKNPLFESEYKQALKTTLILAPAQINAVLQRIIVLVERRITEWEVTAAFIDKLIQKSYNAGHNNFILNTQDTQIEKLGSEFRGTVDNKLKLILQGNAGYFFGQNSKNCNFNIHGNVGEECGTESMECFYDIQGSTGEYCGKGSEGCTYNIHGNAGDILGYGSKNCTYNIQGSTGDECGLNSIYSTFNLQGNIGKEYGNSENCVFTAANKDTYKNLKKQVFKIKRPFDPLTFSNDGKYIKFWTGNKVRYTGK